MGTPAVAGAHTDASLYAPSEMESGIVLTSRCVVTNSAQLLSKQASQHEIHGSGTAAQAPHRSALPARWTPS